MNSPVTPSHSVLIVEDEALIAEETADRLHRLQDALARLRTHVARPVRHPRHRLRRHPGDSRDVARRREVRPPDAAPPGPPGRLVHASRPA